MALIACDFHSRVLNLASSFLAVVPQPDPPEPGRRWPTLFLLHGLSDDHTIWMRRTSIERYAGAYSIAVVMPAVAR